MTSTVEKLSNSVDSDIIIRNAEEFRKKIKIESIPDEALRGFFEEPVKYSIQELADLRKKYLEGTPDLMIIKKSLEKKRDAIIESASQSVDKVKAFISKSTDIENQKNSDGIIEGQNAEEVFDDSLSSINILKGKDGKKTSKIVSEAKEVVSKGKDTVASLGIMAKLENMAEKGGFMGGVASFILFVFGIFGYGKKVDDLKNKAKEKLEPKEIKRIRTEISNKLKDEYLKNNQNLNPILRSKIEEIVNNPELINEDQLIKLSETLKSGKPINIIDIKLILNDSWKKIENSIFDEGTKASLKLELETKIAKQIKERYGLEINSSTDEKLIELIQQHLTINIDDFIILNEKLHNKDEMLGVIDLIKFLGTKPIEFSAFTIGLISEGVVPPENIGAQITKAGKIIITTPFKIFSADGITSDELIEKLQGLGKEKRGLFLGILLRKGQVFTDILGSIAEFGSRSVLELASPNIESGAKMGWNSFLLKRGEQIKSFTKIEKFLGSSVGKTVIDQLIHDVNIIKTNNQIIQFLNKGNKNNVGEIINNIKSIKGINASILTNIDNIKDLTNLREHIAGKIHFRSGGGLTLEKKLIESTIYSAKGQYIDFSRNIENIVNSQKKAIETNSLSKFKNFITKYREITGQANIARQAQAISIEAKTATGILTKMEGLAKLTQDFPLLSKSFFGVLPQLTFTVIDYKLTPENEQDIITSLSRTAKYMSGIIGPCIMVFSPKVFIDDKNHLNWYNIAEAGVGSILLGIDIKDATNLFLQKKYTKILTDVIGRPITAPVKFGIHSYRTGKDILSIAKAEGKINWTKIGKGLSKSLKNGKNWRKVLILGSLIGGGILINEMMKSDLSKETQSLIDKGIIDKQGNIISFEKLHNIYNTFSLEEKNAFINIIFQTKGILSPNGVAINLIDNNHINIVSKNIGIANKEWFVNGEITSILEDLGIKYENINFKYIPQTKKPA